MRATDREIATVLHGVTLLSGSSFCVSHPDGGITPDVAEGYFVRDRRVISRWQLRVDGHPVEPLAATPHGSFEVEFVGRAATRSGHIEPTVTVRRRRRLDGALIERIEVHNYGLETAAMDLVVHVAADFTDVFHVKDGRRPPREAIGSSASGDELHFWQESSSDPYAVTVSAPGALAAPGGLTYRIAVPPGGEWTTTVRAVPSVGGVPATRVPPLDTDEAGAERIRRWRAEFPRATTDRVGLATGLRRAVDDLGSLVLAEPEQSGELVLAAGAPWYMALFGRDSLLTAHMLLPFLPDVASGTLAALGRLQGRETDARTEEQPGRIPHEVRLGADLDHPFAGARPYYGTLDATPLFVVVAGSLSDWTGRDLAELRPAVEAALDWMVTWGDRDGDGFLEYARLSDRGLLNQGWKDSSDSMSFADGALARGPIAPVEVQGYAFAAYLAGARLLRRWGDAESAAVWEARAEDLRARFHDAFWVERIGCYALALDRDKRPLDVMSSNVAHCLWSGIVADDRAGAVTERLMADDMFTGFGLRTLSSRAARFNPVSYHNGSVWPHDSALAAAGMRRYGLTEPADRLVDGLLDALEAFDGRFPELFCGFSRREQPDPVDYPSSCSPQAWASASVFELLRTGLDLRPDGPAPEPALPAIGAAGLN